MDVLLNENEATITQHGREEDSVNSYSKIFSAIAHVELDEHEMSASVAG